jgi:hypothetical protein
MSEGKEGVASTIMRARANPEEALAELEKVPAFDLSYVAFGTHALSNYLTVVAATVEFLLLSLADHPEPQMRPWLEGLQHTTNLMIHTVSQRMTASPTTDCKLRFVQVNFPLLVRRASTYYQRVAERKRMHIIFTSTADELFVRTDPVAGRGGPGQPAVERREVLSPRPAHPGARRQRVGRRGLQRAR